MDPFKKSVLDGGKYSEYRKVGLDFTAVISYKNSFVVNGKPVIVSLLLGEGVACNTIFSWKLLQIIKAAIMPYNNTLVSRILVEQFKLEIMVQQRSKESPKISVLLPVSLSVAIPETQNNTEDIGRMYIIVELKKTVIHQYQIPDQY